MHQKEKFEQICDFISELNVEKDDSIKTSFKLRFINEKFRKAVTTESSLSEIFEIFNSRAIAIGDEFITPLCLFIAKNKQIDDFQVNGKLLRHAVLTILQKNYQNSQKLKKESIEKFYNSINFLGVLFNQMRLASGQTINIIGQSLLSLLNIELEKELRTICHFNNDVFGKLVLSQIAMNGPLLMKKHKTDIENLLLTVRRVLIEVPSLSPTTKAYFLMAIDLFHSNFNSVGKMLEKMYQKFLIEENKPNQEVKQIKEIPLTKPVEEVFRKSLQISPSKNVKVQIQTPETLPKKTSPNGLRNKKSPKQRKDSNNSANPPTRRNHESRKTDRPKNPPTSPQSSKTDQNGEHTPLRQQNSLSPNEVPSSPHNRYRETKPLHKPIYFREENVENLTWNGNHSDNEDDTSKSYTSDFLNFLSNK